MKRISFAFLGLLLAGCGTAREGVESYPSRVSDSVSAGLTIKALESNGGALVSVGSDSQGVWFLQVWTPGALELAKEFQLGNGRFVDLVVEGSWAYVGMVRPDTAGVIVSYDISTGQADSARFPAPEGWRSMALTDRGFAIFCDSSEGIYLLEGEEVSEVSVDYGFVRPQDALWTGELLVVADMAKDEVLAYDLEGRLAHSWKVGDQPRALAFDGAHRLFAVVSGGLQALSWELGDLGTLPFQGAADVAVGPGFVFVADQVGIASIDAQLLSLLGHAPTGRPLSLVSWDSEGRAYGVSADGSTLYMAEP